MTAAPHCPGCGQPIPPDAPAGQCPSCLLGLGRHPARPDASPAVLGPDQSRRLFGDYILDRQIGAGGMGVVYEARHLGLQRKFALKVIRDAHAASAIQVRRFTLEAEAAARLDHPDIVPIHEVGEYEGHPYFSMDLIPGDSLNGMISRGEFTPGPKGNGADSTLRRDRLERIARLMARVARAVQHAHDRGVLHRDLKPGNILVDPDGQPHLTDFGLAKILHPPDGDNAPPTLTASGDFAGTPSYMSPEQVSGGTVTRAADIYGLGAVLYELLAGRPPFTGPTPLETFRQIASQPPARPRSFDSFLPADLETVCLKCLEKDPRRRYSSAEAFAQDLDQWLAGLPIKARAPNLLQLTGRWIKRNPIGTAFIASLTLGLAVALVLLQVVTRQRNQIELDRDQTFEEGINRISLIWADEDTREITITARELAILAGRPPSDLSEARHQLCFGVTTAAKPSSMAQHYARMLVSLQQTLQKELGESVSFRLKLFKRYNQDALALARGEADLMMLGAVHYLAAQQLNPRTSFIARSTKTRELVLFARTNAGVACLADLAGKSLALGDPSLSATLGAKARLVQAGVRASHLRRLTNILDQGPDKGPTVAGFSETIHCVLRGQTEAGLTTRNRFERSKHYGLLLLDRFADTPRVLAVRPGLAPRLVEALRSAVQATEDLAWLEDPSADSPGEGALSTQSGFDDLRQTLQRAEQFDQPLP